MKEESENSEMPESLQPFSSAGSKPEEFTVVLRPFIKRRGKQSSSKWLVIARESFEDDLRRFFDETTLENICTAHERSDGSIAYTFLRELSAAQKNTIRTFTEKHCEVAEYKAIPRKEKTDFSCLIPQDAHQKFEAKIVDLCQKHARRKLETIRDISVITAIPVVIDTMKPQVLYHFHAEIDNDTGKPLSDEKHEARFMNVRRIVEAFGGSFFDGRDRTSTPSARYSVKKGNQAVTEDLTITIDGKANKAGFELAAIDLFCPTAARPDGDRSLIERICSDIKETGDSTSYKFTVFRAIKPNETSVISQKRLFDDIVVKLLDIAGSFDGVCTDHDASPSFQRSN